jgi:hypothetical protein
MATITSAASGNWSNTATWVGGVVPTSIDTVIITSSHIIQADVNITVVSINSTSTGYLEVTTNRTITALLLSDSGNSTAECIRITSTGLVVNIIGNIQGSLTNSGNRSSVLRINGNNNSVNITGNLTTGISLYQGDCILGTGTGNIVNITGNLTASGTGGDVCYPLNMTGINNVFNVIGTVTSTTARCVILSTGSQLFFQGTVTGSATVAAFTGTGTVILKTSAIVNMGSGRFPITATFVRINAVGDSIRINFSQLDNTQVPMFTSSLITGFPVQSDVADGTVYGAASELEGTLLPWDAAFAQTLATAQSNLQIPAILAAITP